MGGKEHVARGETRKKRWALGLREVKVIKERGAPSFGSFNYVHFELVVSTSEHAGCLAGLQHCLVHWVSPFGDLTLSPGGLRVPARARYFHRYFNSSLSAFQQQFHQHFGGLRSTWRGTQFFLVVVLDWGFAGGFMLGDWAGVQLLSHWRIFGSVSGRV